jgi:hypothetical protein
MTERSSEQKRRTWTVRFVAAVVLIAIGVGWRGFPSPQSAVAEESQGRPPKAQRLPGDLVGVLARTTPSYEEPRPVNQVVKVAEPSAQPHSHQPLPDALP